MDDPKFKCPRCGSGVNQKFNLKMHICKKKQCVAYIKDINREELVDYYNNLCKKTKETPFKCDSCNKYYACNSSLVKHVNSVCPHSKKEEVSMTTIPTSYFNELIEKAKNNSSPQIITNNIVNANNIIANKTITNNIILNCFTTPSLKHLPADLLTDCILQQDLPTVIDKVYYDIKVPENRSIRRDENGSYSLYEDGKWRKNNDIVTELFDQGFRILSHHRRENREEVESLMKSNAKNWFDAIIDRDSEIIKPIMNDIQVSLADNKSLLKHTI